MELSFFADKQHLFNCDRGHISFFISYATLPQLDLPAGTDHVTESERMAVPVKYLERPCEFIEFFY